MRTTEHTWTSFSSLSIKSKILAWIHRWRTRFLRSIFPQQLLYWLAFFSLSRNASELLYVYGFIYCEFFFTSYGKPPHLASTVFMHVRRPAFIFTGFCSSLSPIGCPEPSLFFLKNAHFVWLRFVSFVLAHPFMFCWYFSSVLRHKNALYRELY